ncbi:MAG: hypothetical protein IPK10_13655 [Bacteroidetes bacterium]|nr:hypothetical protein [Bacteroidota bacterium]
MAIVIALPTTELFLCNGYNRIWFTQRCLAIHGTLFNLSTTANVVIDAEKGTPQMPITWQTALCSDVCYLPNVNLIQITIPPNGTQSFIFIFIRMHNHQRERFLYDLEMLINLPINSSSDIMVTR